MPTTAAHPGSDNTRRRPRRELLSEASPVLTPSPQNASSRSGSFGCRNRLAGAARPGTADAPVAPLDPREGTGGISGTGSLWAINVSIRRRPMIRRPRPAARACRMTLHADGHQVRPWSANAMSEPRCDTASAKLSATRRPRASMSGAAVCMSACTNSREISRFSSSIAARVAAMSGGVAVGDGNSSGRVGSWHLDLDSDQTGPRAVLLNTTRRRIVRGYGFRHAESVSGNGGIVKCFRKQRRLGQVREGISACLNRGIRV